MDPRLKITCLGASRVQLVETLLSARLSGKTLALFIYLAVTGRSHSRDGLAELLWSELSNQQARNNLRYLLSDLRQVVDDYLTVTRQRIGFNRQMPFWLDVEVLQTTLATKPAVSTSALQAALDLYQGEFLAGFTVRNAPVFEAWVVQQREELHTLALQGLYTLAERYRQQGDAHASLATAQRLLNWEPWHEKGHRLQMQLLATTGQRAAALAQYILCRTVLADELGAEPEAATTALYEQIRRGEYDRVAGGQEEKKADDKKTGHKGDENHPAILAYPHAVIQSRPHNLPGQLTPFFGRDQEVAQLCATLLTPDYRLVTVVGEGGIGKTRLALAVAQAILDFRFEILDSEAIRTENPKFPDGIWFVPLESLTTLDLEDKLATTLANALAFTLSGKTSPVKQIENYLRHKRLLLLFDNCEHLLPDIADFLLQLLQNCPHISVLATSRHLLNLQAEQVWRIEGLPVPPCKEVANTMPTDLTRYSSVTLFVERAKRAHRGFQLTAANQADIAYICCLVEGLPLALELAAALTKQYTCAQIRTTLQSDYAILTTTLRDLPARHRSIKAMLDYSWRFLPPAEAHSLAGCALFSDSFTGAAATVVTEAMPALLTKWVDQSLLYTHEGRFKMHELVRQYAAEQLVQIPERQRAGLARHAAYYLDLLCGQAEALLINFAAQETVHKEWSNIRSAWLWSAEQGDLALLDKGLAGLHRFCRLAGLYGEAIRLLEIALAVARQVVAAAPTRQFQPLLARLLCHIAEFYRRSGELKKGDTVANEALTLGRWLADPALQGLAYHELARLAQVRGDFSTMRTLAEQACTQADMADLPFLAAESLNSLGIAVSLCANPLAASAYFHKAQHALQGEPNHYLEGHVVSNLGYIHLFGHEYQSACRYLPQGLMLKQALQDREGIVTTQILLGDLWMALGSYEAAQRAYRQALVIVQTMYAPYWESWLHASYGRLHHLRGDPAAAYRAYTVAQQIAQQGSIHLHEQWARIYLGHALADLGDPVAAGQCYQQALAVQQQANWSYRIADAHAGLASLLLAQNDVATAVAHAEAALTQLAQQGLIASGEPFRVYWTCVRVLQAQGDARAPVLLQHVYRLLQEQAAKLDDATLRQSFLEKIAVNRQLIAFAQATGIAT